MWRVEKVDRRCWAFGTKDGFVGYCLTEEDAQRVVACVNACRGTPTELLARSLEPDNSLSEKLCKEYLELRGHTIIDKDDAPGRLAYLSTLQR